LGSCEVKSTGGLQNWITVSTKVNKIKGVHDVYFVFKGNQGDLFNFNWWKFDK
jgi:arabinoxylan arabinofuranohydrolase